MHVRFPIGWIALACVLPGFVGAPAQAASAPSFDCAAARGYAEITVCASHDLGVEDALLADTWKRLIEASFPDTAQTLRGEQKTWIARRNACTSEACLTALYQERNEELMARLLAPDPSSATRLDGTFLGTIDAGSDTSALRFDEDTLSLDADAVIRLDGARTPAVERALQGLTLIAFDNREAPGQRINAACARHCRVSGTIEQIERNQWIFTSATAAKALPDDYDFSTRSGSDTAPRAITNGEPPCSVDAGDPLRKTLLDALRPVIERDLGQPVQFVVNTLRKQNDWAFAVVEPRTVAGGDVDFTRTRHAEAVRAGAFDGGTTVALLQRDGEKWVVRAFDVGSTDLPYESWPEQYGAPYSLLGLEVP